MAEKITVDTIGKITSINYDKRIMWVKDSLGVTFELKWRAKPEVVDDICKKQKSGYRVKVTTVKDPNEEDAKFWITNCVFDDSYKKDKRSYAPSPEEQKLILLQSCQRSGAIVFSAILGMPNIVASKEEELGTTFDAIMNKIKNRAIADAAAFQEEAKK
jgi:hypothetical protein